MGYQAGHALHESRTTKKATKALSPKIAPPLDIPPIDPDEDNAYYEFLKNAQKGRGYSTTRLRKKGPHGLPSGYVNHHIVSVKEKFGRYPREVLYLCDIPINSIDNLSAVPYSPHNKTKSYHSPAYFAALGKLLKNYDPRNPDALFPCRDKQTWLFIPQHQEYARAMLRAIAELLYTNSFVH